eukprot:CAMPEP_0168508770 /NCGR_PEP_ID=MMETSP0405-20121227/337_1 /TAXON_ID=498012 /ORGANISM="Trichosphaerium sp, Strain Am-I-7 wt" /LENGTH=138 /DNA_ID=CAMNT_0008526019 /DNA_START=514 /DNA_END=930 /DNA_ORIENTATION=-
MADDIDVWKETDYKKIGKIISKCCGCDIESAVRYAESAIKSKCDVDIYLGKLRDATEPQAIGMTAYFEKDSTINLQLGATLPSAKKRGLNLGITKMRLDDARKRGYKYAVTHAKASTSAPTHLKRGWTHLSSTQSLYT